MKLRTKVILFCAGSALLMTAPLGGLLSHRLSEDRIGALQEDMARQLQRVDVALGVFLAERASDRDHLAANPLVCSREDARCTGFLGADESAFRYDMQPLEQRRIGIFPSYETTHPPINAAYMGRENDSVVRSPKPERPAPCDPRERPWDRLANVVLQHQERPDGSGYPEGLPEEALLPEARIILAADVVEGMASPRPCRPAWGIDAAGEGIEKNNGALCDASVAHACVRLFREKTSLFKGIVLPFFRSGRGAV